jgi:diadenosine tetraphosphate (Ap4A) HIT family hydrolase
MARKGKKFVSVKGAGSRKAYRKQLQKIARDKVCPFCTKYFLRYHERPILRRSKYWLVTENMNPYEGVEQHYLLVYTKHIEDVKKAVPAAWKELLSHIQWISKYGKLKGGTFFMRFGDVRYTGATIAHLHAQLISGVPTGKQTEPIAVTLSHKKKSSRA